MHTIRSLERPATDLATVCRLIVARAANLQRLLDLHGLTGGFQDQLTEAVSSLDHATDALALFADLVSKEVAPPGEDEADPTTEEEEKEEESPGDGLAGNSLVVPVSDILAFLSNLRSSGVLWVDTLEESVQVELCRGEAIYAATDNPPEGERLGEILVEQEALTQELLEEELEGLRGTGEILGTALLRRGIIDRDQLNAALTLQIQLIFKRLFAAEIATYHFSSGTRLVPEPDLRCKVTYLLLECAKQADETMRMVRS